MSLPSSANPSLPREKQPTNVYTVMLILAFCFLVTGSIILATELNQYGQYPWWNTKGGASAAPAGGS